MAGSRSSDDVVWVDVLPSLSGFSGQLRQALGSIAPQAGQQAGQQFGQGFARGAVPTVEAASAKLAAARRKEEDAAGRVRVAEAKLQELRNSGRATTSQLVAAQENLARSQRNLQAREDDVRGSTQRLTEAEQHATAQSRQLGDGMEGASRASGVLHSAIGKLGALVIGGGIIEGLKSLYEAAQDSAKIGRLTTQVIKSTGGAAKITASQVGDLATAVSNKTGVDDEAIQSGENMLLTFTNIRNEAGLGNDIFTQSTKIMNDMSVALGQDMTSSALQLGKALNDPIRGVTALQRVGVAFTDSQKDQIKTLVESGKTLEAQKIILGELGKEFGGAAAAAATPLDKLKVNVGNLAEAAGSYLIPVVDKASQWLVDKFVPAAQSATTWVADHFGQALQTVGSVIGSVISGVRTMVGWFTSLPGPVQTAVAALIILRLLIAGPVSSAFATLGLNLRVAGQLAIISAGEVGTAGTIMAAAGGVARAGWAGFMSLMGGPIGLAIAGVTIALSFLASGTDSSTKATKGATQAQSELAQALRESKGAIDDNVRAAAAKEAQDRGILAAAKMAGIPLSQVTDAILGQGDAMRQVGAQMHLFVDQHNMLSGGLDKEGLSVQKALNALMGLSNQTGGNIAQAKELSAATAETGSTMAGPAAQSAQQLTTELQDTADAASQAKQATDLLKTSLDILTGAHISTSQAEADFYAAVAQADGAMKDLKGTVLDAAGNLNVQSEAGRKAQDVLFGIHDADDQLIATMIQHGATSDQVTAKDAQLRDSFIQSAMQMGISRQAAENLANQILGIPADRKTTITADTAQANAAVAELQKQIDAIHGRAVTITARAALPDLNGAESGSGRMGTFSAGGFTGRGGKYEPKGVVHGGEYVEPQESLDYYGMGIFRALHLRTIPREALAGLPGYAGGGPVPPVSIRTELDTSQYNADMDGAAGRLAKLYEPVTRFIGALAWANTQVGKPYIWGAVGPGGYDCSGFMSAITNVIRGRSPYSRVGSTANFPWPGFAPGYGMFSIGSTPNAGGGIGHMAGTLLGVNVESTGDHVRVGTAARGASSPLFSTRDHLVYDTGGPVYPGFHSILNGTGGVERILTPPQDNLMQRLVDATTAAESSPRTQILDQRQVYAHVDYRQLSAQMAADQRTNEWLADG